MFTAIMKTKNGRVAKLQDGFDTAAKAQAHVDEHIERLPSAFVVTTPDAPVDWWKVDASNVVTVSQPVKSAAEIAAEIDAETDNERSKGERADRRLLFRLMKAASADPDNYTWADFRAVRRKLIANME